MKARLDGGGRRTMGDHRCSLLAALAIGFSGTGCAPDLGNGNFLGGSECVGGISYAEAVGQFPGRPGRMIGFEAVDFDRTTSKAHSWKLYYFLAPSEGADAGLMIRTVGCDGHGVEPPAMGLSGPTEHLDALANAFTSWGGTMNGARWAADAAWPGRGSVVSSLTTCATSDAGKAGTKGGPFGSQFPRFCAPEAESNAIVLAFFCARSDGSLIATAAAHQGIELFPTYRTVSIETSEYCD